MSKGTSEIFKTFFYHKHIFNTSKDNFIILCVIVLIFCLQNITSGRIGQAMGPQVGKAALCDRQKLFIITV
jgi:hypothetical protein